MNFCSPLCFLFLKLTHWELTFLFSSTRCQPEPSKVFKAHWWENEKAWTCSLLKNLTNQGRHQRMLQIDSLIPLNHHPRISLPYFTPSTFTSPWNKSRTLSADVLMVMWYLSDVKVPVTFTCTFFELSLFSYVFFIKGLWCFWLSFVCLWYQGYQS